MPKADKYKDLSDAQLIADIHTYVASDIVGELYRRYGHLVFGIGLKILGNKQDSEDMTMNLFMSLMDKIRNHQIQHFKSWLYRVTLNECYMRLRKNNRISESELVEVQFNWQDDQEHENMNMDCFDSNMEKGMEQLKPEHRTALQLFYREEKTYADISLAVGWDFKTVKSYIQNGKRNLKIILQKMCDGK